MEIQRVHVNPDDDTAVLECPHCGRARTRYVGTCKGGIRSAKVRCPCQTVYNVLFEFRKGHRKETSLHGYYAKLPEANVRGMLLVMNISMTGIGFVTHHMHGLRQGDVVEVRFNLDDAIHSQIKVDAIVRWVEDSYIGCEFMPSVWNNDVNDKALNAYLLR